MESADGDAVKLRCANSRTEFVECTQLKFMRAKSKRVLMHVREGSEDPDTAEIHL